MLIKLPDFDDVLVEQLKASTSQSTGSKAVMHAAQNYLPLLNKLELRDREIADLTERLRVASQVIEGARSAAAQLLEKTAQVDMLSAPDVAYKDRGLDLLNQLRRDNGLRQRDR